MRLVLLGPPGAGKGSLAVLLKVRLKIAHISTGDILREQIKNRTKLGMEAKSYIDQGALVPDELVTRLVEQKLKTISGGYLLDGFPRNEAQAQDLDRIAGGLNQPIDSAIYLQSTREVIIQRLSGRRVCRKCGALFHIHNKPPQQSGICDECGGNLYQRDDDNEATIQKRLDVYLESTKPIVAYYEGQGKLKRVNADQDSKDLELIVLKIFDEASKKDHH